MHRITRDSGWLLACVVTTASTAGTTDEMQRQASDFLDTWCIECHSQPEPKGKLDLEATSSRLSLASATQTDLALLRKCANRIWAAEMPPIDQADRPDELERMTGLMALRTVTLPQRDEIVVTSAPPRRLNRTEYGNTVRDILGIDVAEFGALPPDDVGAGFDNIGAVLTLAPTSMERLMELAESIASRACPQDESNSPAKLSRSGSKMAFEKAWGSAHGDVLALFSNGTATTTFELPREGTYRVTVCASGQQAGPDPVTMSLHVAGKRGREFAVTADPDTPQDHTIEVRIPDGQQKIGVSFDNDYYKKSGADGKSEDRNAILRRVSIEGPMEIYQPPQWRRALASAIANQSTERMDDAEASWLAARMLRRPARDADMKLLEGVRKSLGPEASHPEKLRAQLTALLMHPEFLFRVEANSEGNLRPLDGHELASRLSYFLWSSCPDETLSNTAACGELNTPAGRRAQVDRMLGDARSSTLARRFAAQWLGIDGLESKTPDPSQFPQVDVTLLQSMRQETLMLFESIMRENRQIATLLDADYTFVDAPLAKHYGLLPPMGPGMTRLSLDPSRRGGVLSHASILTATSNPTRTSPVKRGKWTLDALLDAPPPPPPPGTPQIPERAQDRANRSMREVLAIHRSNPECASCHVRMDAIGFAFEAFDPVGKPRDRVDGRPVDSSGVLPDGTTLNGIDSLRAWLLQGNSFTRSLLKHMMVYAIGCAQNDHLEGEIDYMLNTLPENPTIRDLVLAIVESPSFLNRGTP